MLLKASLQIMLVAYLAISEIRNLVSLACIVLALLACFSMGLALIDASHVVICAMYHGME